MDIKDILGFIGLLLSGGILVRIYDSYFPSQKDKNDHQVDLMEEVRKYALDLFARIASVEAELKEYKGKNEKLQREYDDLYRKYNALKKDFETLKSKS